jgi:hypothetical protein
MLTVCIAFRHGYSVDDLNDRLRSNVRYVFKSQNVSRPKHRKAAYRWLHPRHGKLTLKKGDGFSWAAVPRKETRLLGAFVSWLFSNAEDLEGWIEVYEE